MPCWPHRLLCPDLESSQAPVLWSSCEPVCRAAIRLSRLMAHSPPVLQSPDTQPLLSEGFYRIPIFHAKVPALLAFCLGCAIIVAVHSDCPPLADVVWKIHSTAEVNHYGFSLSNLILQSTINIFAKIFLHFKYFSQNSVSDFIPQDSLIAKRCFPPGCIRTFDQAFVSNRTGRLGKSCKPA